MSEVAKEYRKVNKLGHSLSVTIPKKLADQYGIRQGDVVEFIPSDKGILIRPSQTLPPNVDPRFFESMQKIFRDFDETLKNLKDR
ncbi:AbrB/MazE/SpoVT family DNA-binding domain-containing protein [Staphylospora marina]|uniref:AbrB/MazE/SpoVT family DNA-binding domain-containing protein n=1 Tax=Staphylospora marina TaxID=2490858 RepID=UPI000F5BD85B|nr:AbrB/MazE/SpoVT family DNA-binding domain-containing protein [Staphylospora marina]